MVDIVIRHGAIVTMDPDRHVIHDGFVAIDEGRIVGVGRDEGHLEYNADITIDGRWHAVLPGLIDSHGHAGHGLIKTVGENRDDWNELMYDFYVRHTDSAFWSSEAQLSALERLKFGTTTGVSFLGGGAGAFRIAKPEFAREYADGVDKVGIRGIIGVGPSGKSPPYHPVNYRDGGEEFDLDFDRQMENTRRAIRMVNDEMKIQRAVVAINTVAPKVRPPEGQMVQFKAQAAELLDAQRASKMKMISHGGGGTMALAREVGMLGPNISMAHCAGLTPDEVEIVAKSGAGVVHCPRARSIIKERCPVPELLDAGVLVSIGTDGNSPDRTFDLFEDVRAAIRLHRTYSHDAHLFPPGKALEMVTIDAARIIGMADEIGSIETGKRADVILVDLKKAHLVPLLGMVASRLAFEASGSDVDTAIVDGVIRLADGVARGVDEDAILENAEKNASRTITEAGYERYLQAPEGFWSWPSY